MEVYTRDEPEGGTDANISITIDGLRGDTGRRRLLVSQNQQKFKPGQASHSNISFSVFCSPRTFSIGCLGGFANIKINNRTPLRKCAISRLVAFVIAKQYRIHYF